MKKTIKDLLWVSTCVALMLSLLTSCSITAPKDSQQENTESSIDSKVEIITFESENENTEGEIQKTEFTTDIALIEDTDEITTVETYESDLITDIESFEDIEEIKKLLTEFRSFSRTYIFGSWWGEGAFYDDNSTIYTNKNNAITINEDYAVKKWYKVTGGEIKTYSQLIQETNNYCTSDMVNNESIAGLYQMYYFSNNNQLYISDVAGTVGFIGYDAMYIDSIEILSTDTIKLNMYAVGSKEKWDYKEDELSLFSIVLKKENNIWKIDNCGDSELWFLAYLDVS